MQRNESDVQPRSTRDYLWVAARGFAMGSADIVPGVSGGTIAFILGIYDELLASIQAVNLDFVRRVIRLQWRELFASFPWKFLVALFAGIMAAIVTLAQGIHWALDNHPSLVWAFFFGLVLASVVTVRKRVRRWSIGAVITAALAALGAYALVGLAPAQTPNEPWFLFLSGALAICAMILPGLSGAFILVLLGKYQFMLNAVIQRDLISIAAVMAGAVVGLLSFVRLLRSLLRRYPDVTIAGLTGLMLGSLRKVWPWKELGATPAQELNILPTMLTTDVLLAIALAVLGVALVLALDSVASRSRMTAASAANEAI
jgi:putative membrane protein